MKETGTGSQAEDLLALYNGLIGALKVVLAGRELTSEIEAQGGIIFAAAGRLVDQLAQRNPDVLSAVGRLKEDKIYVQALNLAINAVRIGQDASYGRDQLRDLALVALTSGIELSQAAGGSNFKLLAEIIGRQTNLNVGAYKNVINLAEVYEHVHPAGAPGLAQGAGTAAPPLAEDLAALYRELIGALKVVLAGRELTSEIEAQGGIIFAAAGRLVDQLAQRNPDVLSAVGRLKEDKIYVQALNLAINAVRIGQDANYAQDQLVALALTALASVQEMGERGGNLQLLTDVLEKQARLGSEAYKKIINLAEIYCRSAC